MKSQRRPARKASQSRGDVALGLGLALADAAFRIRLADLAVSELHD